MATGGSNFTKQPSTINVMETISFPVDRNIIQNLDFQEFIKNLEDSQHVIIHIHELSNMISILGKKTAIECSQEQIQKRIAKLNKTSANKNEDLDERHTIELNAAKINFLELFGQEILDSIRVMTSDNKSPIINGQLQLSADIDVIEVIKDYLETTLYEENLDITVGMKKYLELTNRGRTLKEFLQKYRVGSSFQESKRNDEQKLDHKRRNNTRGRPGRGNATRDLRGRGNAARDLRGRGNATRDLRGRGYSNRGQRGRGHLSIYSSSTNLVQDFTDLNLKTNHAISTQNIFQNYRKAENDSDEDEDTKRNDDHNDDNNSDTSDSDSSLASIRTNNFKENTTQLITITLCSDSKDSLFNAAEELRNYPFFSQHWALTQDESIFILKQQQRGKPQQPDNSIRGRSKRIKEYILKFVHDYSLYIYIFFYRGIWHVRINGSKQNVQSAILKMRRHFNDVVETEVQIPISEAMAVFIGIKASSDIRNFEKKHNIKITTFPPYRKQNDDKKNKQNNVNHCLKLIGSISRVKSAQEDVENFLENILERENNSPCDSWNLAKNISYRIIPCFKKISHSNDYEAIGRTKFYNSPDERRETTPRITFTIISRDEETMEDVLQQCKDIIEGHFVWKLTAQDFRAINLLKVTQSSLLETFQQEWNVQLQFDQDTNTITIPARSKTNVDEIKEALQNLSKGKQNFEKKITENIPIPRNIRSFVKQATRSISDEAKSQKVNIAWKDRRGIEIHGFQKSLIPIKETINTIVNKIRQSIIIHRFTLSLAESELMRNNSYEILRRIEQETNTVIRDVKVDAEHLNANENNEDISSTITNVVNNRGQTIVVKKGDIIKEQDVDAIVNAANGTLYCAGGVAKMISEAAGPQLEEESKRLIAQNQGAALPTGTAVKTTAGNLPFKSIIHAIGPQYENGNKQECPLLFKCILASLQLAEKEGYTSIALPAIISVTYGFPLHDCTNIVIRAVKQFFADYPESNMRKVILIDINESVYHSFASEVINDHTKDVDSGSMNYIPPPPLTSTWKWKDNSEERIYDEENTRKIEDAFQEFLKTNMPTTLKLSVDPLKIGKITEYSIHFQQSLAEILADNPDELNARLLCGHQMNAENRGTRLLIRYPLAQLADAASVTVYRPKSIDAYELQVITLDAEWEITGMDREAVQQAEAKIRKAIESATVSELSPLNLKDDIESHKNVIRSIAVQESIQVDFQQDSTGRWSMVLKGFKQNVLQARLEITEYTNDILRIEVDKDNQLGTPKEWSEQEKQCELFDIPRNHPDFIRIENRMKETMNNIKIDQIQRVQNLKLWNYYALKRQDIQKKLNHRPNLEMELFHGTRKTPPNEIYDGEHGFDFTFSSPGLWGTGTYFARSASYSCGSYSHALPNGKRQVFLAQVLTGEVFDYKTKNDQTLRRPPKIDGRIPTTYYDSVSGETGNSQVYIIYYADFAYPTYLITFTS